MDNILLTGASSGMGLALLKQLLLKGNKIYALSRTVENIGIDNENLIKIKCDLSNLNDLEKTLNNLKNIDFNVIINVAGVGFFAPHEEINLSKIKNMISVNLQAPLIICQYFLRTIKKNQGTIINISSITAKEPSPFGLAYSATKAGLTHFSHGLFEETRKYGVKVICIHPDMTDTNFFNKLDFECNKDKINSYLNVDSIVDTVNFVLDNRDKMVISDIVMTPQINSIKRKLVK